MLGLNTLFPQTTSNKITLRSPVNSPIARSPFSQQKKQSPAFDSMVNIKTLNTSPAFSKKVGCFGITENYEIISRDLQSEYVHDPVVLDLDDLSTLAAGASNSSLGTVAQSSILVIGGALAFYGTKTAIDQLIVSSSKLRKLKEEKKIILSIHENETALISLNEEALSPEVRSILSSFRDSILDNLAALEQGNHNDVLNENIKYYFSGVSASIGTFGMGIGDFLHPAIWSNIQGITSTTLETLRILSTTFLNVCVPFISLFGAANVIREGYNIYETCRVSDRYLRQQIEADIYSMLKNRIHKLQTVSCASATSYALDAIGAPLTLAIGPLGLTVLLPGVFGLMSTSALKKKYLEYNKYLSVEEICRLGDTKMMSILLRYFDTEINLFSICSEQIQNTKTIQVCDYLIKHFAEKNIFLEKKKNLLLEKLQNITELNTRMKFDENIFQIIEKRKTSIEKQINDILCEQTVNDNCNQIIQHSLGDKKFTSKSFEVLLNFLRNIGLETTVVEKALYYAPADIKKNNNGKCYIDYSKIYKILDLSSDLPKTYTKFLENLFNDIHYTIKNYYITKFEDMRREILDVLFENVVQKNKLEKQLNKMSSENENTKKCVVATKSERTDVAKNRCFGFLY